MGQDDGEFDGRGFLVGAGQEDGGFDGRRFQVSVCQQDLWVI